MASNPASNPATDKASDQASKLESNPESNPASNPAFYLASNSAPKPALKPTPKSWEELNSSVDPNDPKAFFHYYSGQWRLFPDDVLKWQADANSHMGARNYHEAITRYETAMVEVAKADGLRSARATDILYSLGWCYLQIGLLKWAQPNLERALTNQNLSRQAGPGSTLRRLAAAKTREALARVAEARGDFGEAKRWRYLGKDRVEVLCANEQCQSPEGVLLGEKSWTLCFVKGCEHAVFCSQECFEQDLPLRHVRFCEYTRKLGRCHIVIDKEPTPESTGEDATEPPGRGTKRPRDEDSEGSIDEDVDEDD
ncbi:hypothetical protein diail_11179 [Diaporthe ilicicola]|nr:hypothetical protein diail_11179 [Diaporthe ilicicola]